MLIGRGNWRRHLSWIVFTVAATAAASAWYFVCGAAADTWPGGSSLPGFVFGVLGGLICLFEFLLWGRKKIRAWRIGRAQTWMRAHIWLGLLCVPLLILHSGLRLGGTLSTVLMVLLLVVVASGICGLVLQQSLPSRLLDEVPAETIYSQIDYVVGQLCDEAEHLVHAVCGPPEEEAPRQGTDQPAASPLVASHLVVGAVRTAGRIQGKVLQTRAPSAPVAGSEPLRLFFTTTLAPYLRRGAASRLPLTFSNRTEVLFQDLRTKMPSAAHGAVDALQSLCEQRRQLDAQAWIHFWLHSWLWVHLPLSVALIVLLFVHVWVALKYW